MIRIITPVLFFLIAVPVWAQTSHDAGHAENALPEVCMVEADSHAGHAMSQVSEPSPQSLGHDALMQSMTGMHEKMSASMSADDVDVAFVCGMIVHHQGAVDMARAELAHGNDDWAKSMAQKIIDAQEAEIIEMTAWLNRQTP